MISLNYQKRSKSLNKGYKQKYHLRKSKKSRREKPSSTPRPTKNIKVANLKKIFKKGSKCNRNLGAKLKTFPKIMERLSLDSF